MVTSTLPQVPILARRRTGRSATEHRARRCGVVTPTLTQVPLLARRRTGRSVTKHRARRCGAVMNETKKGVLIDDPPYRDQQEPPMNLHQLLDAM
jgi:hypothetical protein